MLYACGKEETLDNRQIPSPLKLVPSPSEPRSDVYTVRGFFSLSHPIIFSTHGVRGNGRSFFALVLVAFRAIGDHFPAICLCRIFDVFGHWELTND